MTDTIVLLAVDRKQGVFYASKDYNRTDWIEGRIRVVTSIEDLQKLRGYKAVMVGEFTGDTPEQKEMMDEAEKYGTIIKGVSR